MCCWGYCVDLLLNLAKKNEFSFSLFLAPDGQYGELSEGPDGKTATSGQFDTPTYGGGREEDRGGNKREGGRGIGKEFKGEQ